MALAVVFVSFLVCILGLVGVYSAPQFGGSFSQANAQAGSFGGGYGPGFQGSYRPRFYGPPRPPGFGSPGFGSGLSNRGGSISISKSISISRGGGGAAQSSAQSSAAGK